YKKEWEAQKNKAQNSLLPFGAPVGLQPPDRNSANGEEEDKDPQEELQKSGEIPNDFLRQMFYTLADYKDILFSGDKDKKNGYNDIITGDKEMEQRESKIKEAIQEFFEQNSNKEAPPPEKNPGQTAQQWWQAHGPDIWKGMVCALTYKETSGSGSDGKTTTITQDTGLKEALLDTTGKKPKIPKYEYNTVKLDDTSGAKQTEAPASSGDTPTLNNPKLTQFVKIPPFFRWLHEWGSDFCDKRARMLEQLEKVCRSGKYGKEHCSGDGHVCDKKYLQHNDMFADLFCRDCHKQCRKYRKWIDIKFVEYHNQKNKYGEEHGKLPNNSNGGDNNCCNEIEKHTTAPHFLAALKHCKNYEGDKEKVKEDEKNKTDFNKPLQTFSPSTYCETCPPNKVNCSSGSRRSGGNDQCTAVNGNKWQSVFNSINGKVEKSTIEVEMIDRRWPFIKNYLENSQKLQNSNDLFKTSRLFKGIRKQNWTCKFNKDEKMDVCHLTNFNDKIDLNPYTTFKVLLHYWLEDFIEGYYILKKRKVFEQCKENGGNKCSEESKKNCACVKTWVAQKTTEWNQIKDHYNKKEYGKGNDIKSKVRNFLETLIPRMDLTNGKKKIQQLNEFLRSYECKCVDNAGNSEKDVVECLLQKLEKEATSCPAPTSGKETNCDENTTPQPDEEEELLEENPENTVGKQQPSFCPTVEEKKKEVEDGCKPAEEKSSEEPEQTPVLKPEEEVPAPEGTEQLPHPPVEPPQADQPLDPTILQTTIPFGSHNIRNTPPPPPTRTMQNPPNICMT
ncbi:hypothetical protein PFFCH_05760, partial [Plasmodium falciparum FCH/4]